MRVEKFLRNFDRETKGLDVPAEAAIELVRLAENGHILRVDRDDMFEREWGRAVMSVDGRDRLEEDRFDEHRERFGEMLGGLLTGMEAPEGVGVDMFAELLGKNGLARRMREEGVVGRLSSSPAWMGLARRAASNGKALGSGLNECLALALSMGRFDDARSLLWMGADAGARLSSGRGVISEMLSRMGWNSYWDMGWSGEARVMVALRLGVPMALSGEDAVAEATDRGFLRLAMTLVEMGAECDTEKVIKVFHAAVERQKRGMFGQMSRDVTGEMEKAFPAWVEARAIGLGVGEVRRRGVGKRI